jgi:hypothetical protein
MDLTLEDTVWNSVSIVQADLAARGFPTTIETGFLEGQPKTIIVDPPDNRRIHGNSVTARARLVQGDPTAVSSTLGVRFDYRVLPFGNFDAIPARNAKHRNPDTTYPYFVHWDVSALPDGDYELRAVAHDLAGNPDPAPATITITIDHAGPVDVEEYVNAEGRQESQTVVDSASEGRIASGDHTDASTATDLTLPPGSLLYATDTAKLVYPHPANEESHLEQVEQSIGAFVDLSLLSGQISLEGQGTGDLNITFSDANQDSVVDGTSIREEDLELRRYDPTSGSYVVVPGIVLIEHNMVHADVSSLGKYALVGPLLPKVLFEADKQSLTWEAVSAALSYTVYRGSLADLVDGDGDGLPDAGYGECRNHLDPDVTDTAFLDSESPGTAGEGFFYIVGFVATDGQLGLGNTSAGLRRSVVSACP